VEIAGVKLFTGQMPFLSPTDSVEALKEEVIAVNTRFMHCVSKKVDHFIFMITTIKMAQFS